MIGEGRHKYELTPLEWMFLCLMIVVYNKSQYWSVI